MSSATPPPPSHAGKVVPRTAAGEEEAGREEGGAVGGAGTWYKGRGALKVQFGPHTEGRWVGGEGAHGRVHGLCAPALARVAGRVLSSLPVHYG